MKLAFRNLMQTSCFKDLIPTLFLFIYFTSSCFALPGQDVNQILSSAEKKPVIGKLIKTINPYNKQISYNNYSNNTPVDFLIVTSIFNQSLSEFETISTANKQKKVSFIRTDVFTYDLLKEIYSKDIAEDFKQAKFCTKFKTNYGSRLVQVFKGKKFSYFNFSKELHIRALSTIERDIDNYKTYYGKPD